MNYEERKKRWNENKSFLRKWTSDESSSFQNLEEEIKEGLRLIIGKSGSRNSSSSVNDRLRLEFVEKKILNRKEIFIDFDLGKVGMRNFIKSQLLRKDPNDYIWINYDEKDGTYEMVGRGKNPPKNYSGWIPPEMRD